MIDFEDDLRRRLHTAAATQTAPPDHLDRIERRARREAQRRPVLRVAAAAAGLALVAGAAVAATRAGDEGGGERTPVASAGPKDVTEDSTSPSGWATMADSPLSARTRHLVLALDDRVLVWGGSSIDDGGTFLRDGAVYDPIADTWAAVPDAPLTAAPATGVWTGEEAILVTGGQPSGSGSLSEVWEEQPRADADPTGRATPERISDDGQEQPTGTTARPGGPGGSAVTPDMDPGGSAEAAAYDPATDTWRDLADPPVDVTPTGSSAVWTGTEVVVLSRDATGSAARTTAVVYDPATDTWTEGTSTDMHAVGASVVWTGSEVVMVGSAGTDPSEPGSGELLVRAYDPASDAWRSLPGGLDGGSRSYPVVAWTGDRLFIGGGWTFGGDEDEQSRRGALLDPATGTWTATSPAPVPVFGPERGPVLWTGDRVLTLGGSDGATLPALGMGMGAAVAYDPATDTWTAGPVRPGDGGLSGAGWAWSAGRAVVPLGGTTDPNGDGGLDCCSTGPAGGATYTP